MSTPAYLPLIPTQFLPTVVGVLYTAQSGVPNMMVMVNGIVLANQSAGGIAVTIYNVPAGGAPVASNIIVPAFPVPGNSFVVLGYEEGLVVLPVGGTLQGFAGTVSTVTITAHGRKYGN